MDVSVTAVTFKQNEAEATVAFASKGSGGAAQGMTMRYTLEKQGGRWVVKGRSDSGQHGAGGMQGMPGMGGAMPGEMPPGHPAVPAPKK
jgi:hypothetical protein